MPAFSISGCLNLKKSKKSYIMKKQNILVCQGEPTWVWVGHLTANLQETEGLDEQIKPHQGKPPRQSHFIGKPTQVFFNMPRGWMGVGKTELIQKNDVRIKSMY